MKAAASLKHAAFVLALLIVAGGATAILYAATLEYGFAYDDYHFVRPHTWSEVAAAFRGPWDKTGIEVALYRPLTIAFFAIRFELFGLNAVSYHWLSLIVFTLTCVVFGLFVRRACGGRAITGVLACAFFAVHPAMPYALVCWATNQMHLLEILAVTTGLLWWASVGGNGLARWLPVVILGVAAFLIKEDGLMFLPAVLVLHVLWRHVLGESSPPLGVRTVVVITIVLLGCVLVRTVALGGLGGYHRPTADIAIANYTKGLRSVFWLEPARRPWQMQSSWFACLLPLLGLLCGVLARNRAAVFGILAGVSTAVVFNLPFVFVTKAEQYHLIALGACLAFAAGALGVIDAFRAKIWQLSAGAIIILGLAAMGAVSKHITADFDPYGPIVLGTDKIVQEWDAVPRELRAYLKAKAELQSHERLSSNPVDVVPVVTWGLLEREVDPSGTEYRWLGGMQGNFFISNAARSVEIPVRHLIEFTHVPVTVQLVADDRLIERTTLRDRDWHVLRSRLQPEWVNSLRGMHRVQLTVDRTWSPVEVIPRSSDTRVFGVQVGRIELR